MLLQSVLNILRVGNNTGKEFPFINVQVCWNKRKICDCTNNLFREFEFNLKKGIFLKIDRIIVKKVSLLYPFTLEPYQRNFVFPCNFGEIIEGFVYYLCYLLCFLFFCFSLYAVYAIDVDQPNGPVTELEANANHWYSFLSKIHTELQSSIL